MEKLKSENGEHKMEERIGEDCEDTRERERETGEKEKKKISSVDLIGSCG